MISELTHDRLPIANGSEACGLIVLDDSMDFLSQRIGQKEFASLKLASSRPAVNRDNSTRV